MTIRFARVAALALVAGCGIPTAERPQLARDADVPFGLLAPATSTTSTTALPENTTSATSLCLYQGDNVVTVSRELRRGDLFDSLRALEQRTSPDERQQGLETALPGPGTFVSADVVAGVARIDLAASFAALPAAEQLRVVAQVVCTATAQPGVGQVLFTLEGAPIDVPRGDGSLASGAVTRDAYPRIASRLP